MAAGGLAAVMIVAMVMTVAASGAAVGQDAVRSVLWPTSERPAYPTSPYHGAIDGDGRVIPCRCRFQGREFRVGEEVCMSTYAGIVLARCDLLLNNTSWIPTTTTCTLSGPTDALPAARFAEQR